jgi:serine protease AprX
MKTTREYIAVLVLLAAVISMAARARTAGHATGDIEPRAKCSERLSRMLESPGNNGPFKIWIYFRDRGPGPQRAVENISERALERRRIRSRRTTDRFDLPVNTSYISAVRVHAAGLRHVSRYFNAVSALVQPSGIEAISSLAFVERIDIVKTYRRTGEEEPGMLFSPAAAPGSEIYGGSYDQLAQIGVVPLLELGYNGSGTVTASNPVLVCVMDTGFRLDHEALAHINVIARYDFIQGDTVVQNQDGDHIEQDRHGTIVLGALAGYHEEDLVGPAWGADFLLAKTEIYGEEIEIEEDNWIAGIEWADSAGAEIISSSLGYIDWYTPADLDGDTPLCTQAADIAAEHGIVVVTAMGNYGAAGDTTLIAPADGDSVIAVGAVDRYGFIAPFSSRGPTADGRIKPDLVALGVGTYSVQYPTFDSYATSSGTSLSTPLVAGLCAQLLEIKPDLTPESMRELLTSTSSRSENPDIVYGYGIPDGVLASGIDVDPTTVVLGGAYPNPFRSRTSFHLDVPPGERVAVRIYDCRGALVKEIPAAEALVQGGSLVWDGTNSQGLHVATGLYFVRFSAAGFDRTIKVLLIR